MSRAALLLAVAVSAGVGPVRAQDVAMRGEQVGLRPPPAYLEDLSREPRLFTFPGPGWGRALQARGQVTEGTLPVLVIPALFADSRDPHISREAIQQTLFDGPTPDGTLTEFYREVSLGRLEVSGEVTPWVRTHLPLEVVTAGQAGFGEEARVLEYLWRALEEVDPLVDFGRFDNDGPDGVPNSGDDDGYTDAVAFEFLEVSGSCGGPGIWPHRSAISWRTGGDPFLTSDAGPGGPIKVDAYIIQSVTDCSGIRIQTANVISHEMGHVLGLPDLYHPIDGIEPTQRRWVVGCWGLMAAGSWGCGDPSSRTEGYGPVRMAPWSLAQLGWVDFQVVESDVRYREYRITPTIGGGRPLRIPLDRDGRESLVLEYRTREGFDRPLPGQGLLAYLWNEDGQFRPTRESDLPYRFRLLEGDGRNDLIRTHENGGNRGELSDLLAFPGNAPSLSAVTSPSTLLSDGSPSPVTIHRVAIGAGEASVWVSTSPEPAVLEGDPSPISAYSGYVQFHRVAGGVQPYQVTSLSAPEWLTVRVEGDRLDLTGVPLVTGPAEVTVEVRDAGGATTSWSALLDVGPFSVPLERIARSIFSGAATATTLLESQVLDDEGNRNGRLDVGDLRAHLRR